MFAKGLDYVPFAGLREGLDHFGFVVESLEQTNKALEALSQAENKAAPTSQFVGGNGKKNQEDFRRCCLGRHFIAGPDGVLIDIAE
jgi:hypothetical protein